jgi:hypothetical protein
MAPDVSAAVAAVATCVLALVTAVLAVAAIGAFVYAKRTFRAQSDQLEVAREEAWRLRTPVLRGEVSSIGQGVPNFRLDVRLVLPSSWPGCA